MNSRLLAKITDQWVARLFAFVFILKLTLCCHADDPSRFFAVTNWYATFSRTLNETGSSESTDSDGCVISTHWSFNHSTTVSFQLMPDPQFIGNPFIRNFIWKQDDSFNVAINDDFTQTRTCTAPDGTTFVTHDRRTSNNPGLAPATTNVSVVVNALGDSYQIDVTDLTIPLDTEIINDVITIAGPNFVRWAPVHELMDSLPATGLVLKGSTNFPMSDYYSDISPAAVEFGVAPLDSSLLTADLKLEWSLSPTVEELEVVIKSPDYKTWVPEGSLQDQNSAGNVLGLTAVLQTKDGKEPATSRATQFKFELLNVSAEPGVCLNYPNESASTKPDLKFEAEQNADLIIENSGASASTFGGKYLQAEVGVSSFDFGAFGELKVTALVNGKEIVGYWELDPEKKKQPLLLPRRKPESKIADQWKEDNKATDLADDDDNENEPVGDGHTGDGLSLYEEYRGFSQNGAILRTNPKKKDLMVLNTVGGPGAAACQLFQKMSQIQVHHRFQAAEFSSAGTEDNWLNFNGSTHHAVDQHGLRIVLDPSAKGFAASYNREGIDGNSTPGSKSKIAVPPDLTTKAAGDQSGRGFAARYAAATYAHEIAHGCSVYHHGESDIGNVTWTATDDVDGVDWSEDGAVIFPKLENGTPLPPVITNSVGKRFYLPLPAYVGDQQGQHSGDTRCAMRYDCADAYVYPLGSPDRYVGGGEVTGNTLCTSGAGFGVNATGRPPRPRFGDASEGRGNCKGQLCVNDKYVSDDTHKR